MTVMRSMFRSYCLFPAAVITGALFNAGQSLRGEALQRIQSVLSLSILPNSFALTTFTHSASWGVCLLTKGNVKVYSVGFDFPTHRQNDRHCKGCQASRKCLLCNDLRLSAFCLVGWSWNVPASPPARTRLKHSRIPYVPKAIHPVCLPVTM
jgi:hypothetical protein